MLFYFLYFPKRTVVMNATFWRAGPGYMQHPFRISFNIWSDRWGPFY